MEIAEKTTLRRIPVFGIISIATPFLGAGLACIAFGTQPPGDESWFHPVLGVFLILASLICGMFMAVIGKYRDEKPRLISWIGFLLNTVPLLFILVKAF